MPLGAWAEPHTPWVGFMPFRVLQPDMKPKPQELARPDSNVPMGS